MIITLQTFIFFRESLVNALDRLLRPYYKKFSLAFSKSGECSEDEESDEQVFAEFDEERGVVFYPPMYLQRYAAVSDCLMDEKWRGKLEKVVDLGYHDISFIKYLKEVQGIKCILGVDLESIPLRYASDLVSYDDYIPKRENPLQVTLFKGNAADPDYRLIGCDAVIGIEMIEHMLPHDLERLVHTVFGFIKPQIAIFTTPNGDFNVLFKALEKNGLRRLDHFFEWSQEQFHDWCSNIVLRYPQYTVSCKGIGPGPVGTKHLGCCSQMALFTAKEYTKQQDLNLNSLALVSDSPSPNSISNLISSWEEIPNESNMIEPPKNIESYSELYSSKESCITIVLTSPSISTDTIQCQQDKNVQCNLDDEASKNYLMFDYEQMCFDMVVPRNKMDNKVYDIEDVNSRLNCTTLQVNKFSKTTQNLMAKNKVDALVYTREVIEEIRHLTRMLNFNKESPYNQLENGTHTWCNINWGENAPYWNQYYKIVNEYNYPFETKSEEGRILDLISDEINKLIDAQYEDVAQDTHKLEIPIGNLMSVVEHITDDVEKVRDLLEWNGYEISGDMVIHSRLVVDTTSITTEEECSQETDTYSDWDSTDIRSTSMSEGSTMVPDFHARCLRRALDQKVRKLRSMLTADEDITTELDRVVCRLMKLALRTSKGRDTPPPAKWMQCKLLDLLTLTEKSIERRKRHFIQSYPLKAINYDEKSQGMIALEKIKEDDTASKIVDKYKHLVNQTDGKESRAQYRLLDFSLDDDLSVSSMDFAKDYEFIDKKSPNIFGPENALTDATQTLLEFENPPKAESKLERTQAWVEEDIEVVPYPNHDANFDETSNGTNHSATKVTKYYRKRYKGKKCIELNCMICKKSRSNAYKQHRNEDRNKTISSKTKRAKKMSRKKSSNSSLGRHSNKKFVSVDHKTYRVKPRKKQHKTLYPTVSKPIPLSLIELCHPEGVIDNETRPCSDHVADDQVDQSMVYNKPKGEVAATTESLLIEIVTDDTHETIALRRSIGTDADDDSIGFEDETLIRSVSNTLMDDDHLFDKETVATENVHSQTIFLYDIDEPTTSKGIRHIRMDVQCGPDDAVPAYSMLSPTASLTRMPKVFEARIKIEDSMTNTKIRNADCGTSTNDSDSTYKTILPRDRSVGITIKDSNTNLMSQIESPPVFACSTISAITSLTMVSKVTSREIKNIDSKISNNETESAHCSASCYSQNTFITKTINFKVSDSNLSKRNKCTFVPAYIMLSATTSLSRMSKVLTAGITIENFTDTKMKNAVSGTYSNSYTTLLPKQRSIDVKIDNISIVSTQNECSTETQDFLVIKNISSTPSPKQSLLRKSIPIEQSGGIKIKDAESCFSKRTECSTNTQTPSYSKKNMLLKSPNELKTKESFELQARETTAAKDDFLKTSSADKTVGDSRRRSCKYVTPKLCNGGVQVHSYTHKKMSEDIMYQGEWQRNQLKILSRRKNYNAVAPKNNIDSSLKKKVRSKERVQNKNVVTTNIKQELRKSRLPHNIKLASITQNSNRNIMRQNQILPVTVGVTSVKKPFRNILKVPSKFPMSSKSPETTKSAFVVTKNQIVPNNTVISSDKSPARCIKKNYIPLYLRHKILQSTNNLNKNDLNLSFDSVKSNNIKKISIEKASKPLIRSKTEEIKRNLLKFQAKTPQPRFVVLRNEIDKKSSDVNGQSTNQTLDSETKRDAPQISVSSCSPSSTCSSPCSIATVRQAHNRPKTATHRRRSTSFSVSNTGNSGSENSTPERNRKFPPRLKSVKTAIVKVSDNKENIPQTSKQLNTSKKKYDKKDNSAFMGQKKAVFVAHLRENSPLQSTGNTLSKHKTPKSNVNISESENVSIKTTPSWRSPLPSKKASLKSDAPLTTEHNEVCQTSQTSNMVLIIEPQARELLCFTEAVNAEIANVASHRLVTNWIDSSNVETVESSSVNLISDMRELIDETLDFIDDPFDKSTAIDSETVILSRPNSPLQESPISFKTIITNDDNYNEMIQNDIEYALNRSFDTTLGDESMLSLTDTKLTVTDFDLLSLKSLTSTSKCSEYLSADNEYSSSIRIEPNTTSVRDLFERRADQPFQPVQAQNNPGALAIQAFSGFSINGEPVSGDQPDPVNLIDSETGSLAVDVGRQATSEELLISARSSESFESCLLDEDSVVPNWLFQMMNQQQSAVDDIEPPDQFILPDGEPMYDDNGNLLDGAGLGAGAGDGRGMHSDQDSSGQGNSLSSSESSSGVQSEAILIDPSALIAQFEMLRDARVESSVVVLAINDAEHADNAAPSRQGPVEIDSRSFSRGEARRNPRAGSRPTTASDVDADVSSLETDAPDSDN